MRVCSPPRWFVAEAHFDTLVQWAHQVQSGFAGFWRSILQDMHTFIDFIWVWELPVSRLAFSGLTNIHTFIDLIWVWELPFSKGLLFGILWVNS